MDFVHFTPLAAMPVFVSQCFVDAHPMAVLQLFMPRSVYQGVVSKVPVGTLQTNAYSIPWHKKKGTIAKGGYIP